MTVTRRQALGALAAATAWGKESSRVVPQRLPAGALQPQVATGPGGLVHALYYTGEPQQGMLHYRRASAPPLLVNTKAAPAVAAGTIRGAQISIGMAGRVHIAWNGPGPRSQMFYTRLNDAGTAFEPARGLMRNSADLDGGGSLAADTRGNVYVMWHANEKPGEGEARRRIWLAKSTDDGVTFSSERAVFGQETGACGCCGMKLFADSKGGLTALYRSAVQAIHRDIYSIRSEDGGASFRGRLLHKWDINACPMTSMDIAESRSGLFGAWETGGQIYWSRLDNVNPAAAPGLAKARKHPRLAFNRDGEMLLVWTEGAGWKRGGTLAWQLYDNAGQASQSSLHAGQIPVWSFAAPVANAGGGFSVYY